jgi:beta-lactamase class A
MFPPGIDRRVVLGGAALLQLSPALAQASIISALEQPGSRIGVAALNTGNGRTLFYRADERFLMCSTFKLALAAAVLHRVDRGEESLDRVVRYRQEDLLPVSPVTSANLSRGLSVEALCAAIIHVSDNTAANVLLRSIGGPSALTAFLLANDDKVTRLDRNEPLLNVADGEKDTTTPRAMLNTLRTLLLGPALQTSSRRKLIRWMEEVTTGITLLRSGLPRDWRAGDKTGRSQSGAINDLIIAYPPRRAPILICAYTEGASDTTLANAGRAVAAFLR